MTSPTGTDQSGMPFGAVFGAMYFALYAAWLVAGVAADAVAIVPRAFLAVASGALALALAGRRGWARWTGALGAIATAAISLRLVGLDLGAMALVAVLGALLTLVLLLVPSTGELRAPRGAGRVLAAVLGVSVVGFVASIGLLGDSALDARAGTGARASSGSTDRPAADAPKPQGRVPWTDFGTALTRARSENKPILVTFVTGWCGYCRKMDQTTWRDAEVIARLNDVLTARIDAEDPKERNGYSGVALAERYGVQGFPTLVVLDAAGRMVSRTSGYQAPDDLIDWLDQVLGRERPQRYASNPVRRS
jgi:thiol:disulfide interchange protein